MSSLYVFVHASQLTPSSPAPHSATELQCADQPRWYAVHSRSRHEKHVQKQLERNAVECFLPLYETVHRWQDRRALVNLPLFPGYLFARILASDRMKVLTAAGVVRLISVRGQPVAIPDHEIDTLRNCCARNMKMEPHPYLTAGRRVLVKSGPFTDIEGILVRRKGQFRLVVSVNLIARSVALEVDTKDVVPLPTRATEPQLNRAPMAMMAPQGIVGRLSY